MIDLNNTMMQKLIILSAFCLLVASCTKLDLNPLSEGSSENWYRDETEVTMSLNDLYRTYTWTLDDGYGTECYTDNYIHRTELNDITTGALNGQWSGGETVWKNTYKDISRANAVINSLDKIENMSKETAERLSAEARLFRAVFYGRLIFYWGDVPYFTKYLDIDAAFSLARTDKTEILKNIYKDFDSAIAYLPESYGSGEVQRVTKGAAYAFKARVALLMGDYKTARDAAKGCMDLGVYKLHPDYGQYFLSSTRESSETIFAVPRSSTLGVTWSTSNYFPRNPGGTIGVTPSWGLLAAYPCTDGKPIDKSDLFDPHDPFKHRDPRLAETIVPFNTEFLGFIYDPNPYSTKVLNTTTGKMVKNKDTRSVDQYATYNAMALKKGVDMEWVDDKKTDADIKIMRYADVLLMYAEAKIELDEIDQSTLDAINQVRARAYKVAYTDTDHYPAVTETNQSKLRTILRTERRIELAWENRRYDDLIRWKIADQVLNTPTYGMLDPDALKSKLVDKGLWFWPETPPVDSNDIADFSSMYNKGYIKLLAKRAFDKREYLWPIPTKEILINDKLTQNPGY